MCRSNHVWYWTSDEPVFQFIWHMKRSTLYISITINLKNWYWMCWTNIDRFNYLQASRIACFHFWLSINFLFFRYWWSSLIARFHFWWSYRIAYFHYWWSFHIDCFHWRAFSNLGWFEWWGFIIITGFFKVDLFWCQIILSLNKLGFLIGGVSANCSPSF